MSLLVVPNGQRRLILRDVERADDLLLAFSGIGELLFMLKRLLKLLRQISRLALRLCDIGFAFAEAIFNPVQRVFERCDRADGAVADVCAIAVFAVDQERYPFVKPLN